MQLSDRTEFYKVESNYPGQRVYEYSMEAGEI